jgi:hypothetical protein
MRNFQYSDTPRPTAAYPESNLASRAIAGSLSRPSPPLLHILTPRPLWSRIRAMEWGLRPGPRGTGTLDVKIGELADGRDGGRTERAAKEARQEWDAGCV